MKTDELVEQIQEARTRIGAMEERSAALTDPIALLPETLEELRATLEELQVAEEELRQQNEELHAAHLAVTAQRERYQELFEMAPDGYLVTDAQGIISEANLAASRMLGLSSRYVTGKPLANYVAEAERSEFRQRLLSLREAGAETAHFSVTLTTRQGEQTPVDISVSRALGQTSKQGALRWIARDARGRLKAEEGQIEAERARLALAQEQAARTEAERLERQTREQAVLVGMLLTTAPVGFAFVDRDARYIQVNEAYAQLFNYSAEAHTGQSIAEVTGEALWNWIAPLFEQACAGASPRDRETHSPGLDGVNRHLSMSFYPARAGDEIVGVGIVVTDITGHKTTEAALQETYEREHRIAETLQRSLLGAVPPGGFANLEVATFYEAALDEAQVGGDFFDVFTLDSGKVALLVGDVSGKGLHAAACTAEIKYTLRAFLREDIMPKEALYRLNNFMCDARRQNDWGDDIFATMVAAVIDPSTGTTWIALAGAEPVLLLRASGQTEEIAASGMVLGVETNRRYTQNEMSLLSGDTLLMTTDGITEARQGPQFLGLDGLRRLSEEARNSPTSQQMGEAILREVHEFVSANAGGSLHDDACILIARRTGE